MSKPDAPGDPPGASPDLRELFRYKRGDDTRIYSLRAVPTGAELWRITQSPGEAPASLKECDLTDTDDAIQFLEEVKRALIAGGWREQYTVTQKRQQHPPRPRRIPSVRIPAGATARPGCIVSPLCFEVLSCKKPRTP